MNKTISDVVKMPENGVKPRKVGKFYTITESEIVGDFEIAFGSSENFHGTWVRSVSADEAYGGKENWWAGHYYQEKEEALADYNKRLAETR